MRFHGILPAEATSHALRIVLSGRNALLVEQHRGLMTYDDSCVRLRSENGFITISGQALSISQFGEDDALISGRIDSLEFTP